MKRFPHSSRTARRAVLLFGAATTICLMAAGGCGNGSTDADNAATQASAGTGNPNAPAIVQQQSAQQQEMAKRQGQMMQQSNGQPK